MYIYDLTLSAGANTINPPYIAAEGRIMAVQLTQPGSGSSTVTWEPSKFNDGPTDLTPYGGDKARLLFIGKSDGYWHCYAGSSGGFI